MKRHEEDEIQVLGQAGGGRKRGGGKRFLGYLLPVLAVALLITGWFLLRKTAVSPQENDAFPLESDLALLEDEQQLASGVAKEVRISVVDDTVNDVPMQVFVIEGAKARLCIGRPAAQDTTVLMALPAADVRKDNLGIVGDFVLDGRRYGNGKRKEGYGALLEGQLFLGVSASDTVMNYCASRQGSFFRQYALVADGKIWPNRLKGKSLRRAVARKADDARVYVVVSRQRESLYDFSEALADYGMHDALYLPGGDAYAFCKVGGDTLFLGLSEEHVYPNTNYLVFGR